MATFYMMGKYTAEGLKGISSKRMRETQQIIKELGGKVKSINALLGSCDLVLIVELPGVPEAMKASILLCQLTGIAFTTSPALSVEEFDKLLA